MRITEIKGIETVEELLALACCADDPVKIVQDRAKEARDREDAVRTENWNKWLDTTIKPASGDIRCSAYGRWHDKVPYGYQDQSHSQKFELDGKAREIRGLVSGEDCLSFAIEKGQRTFIIREVYEWRKEKDKAAATKKAAA